MTDKRRPSKTFAITIDEELQAMALIKKAMELVKYPYAQTKLALWVAHRYGETMETSTKIERSGR